MQKVGVEAVVEGLGAFIRDTGRINSALDGIRPRGTLLQQTFSGIGESLRSFGREVLNVAEVALGVLLARAIEFVIGKLKELVSATIEAGAEFQTMQLRLNRLNLNTILEEGRDYVDVMAAAVEMTQEQLKWIQKLAVQTPYDAQDIANVFTLARSYGFAADEAQALTEDISNFAAGMGLGNVEIERIIVNFGQMVQQGKVTQREMNDLARGAFVPVNDVLKRMQENIGLTGAAFDEFRTSGEGVEAFFVAFSQIVEERFQGAAQDMARTFQGASANARDFIKSLLGFGVVRPVLDAIGSRIADLINSLTDEKNWDRMTNAAGRVGEALTGLVTDVLGLMPSTDDLAENIIVGLNKIADWITNHRSDIMNFFKGIGETIQTKVVPFVQKIVEAFNTIRDWVQANSEAIREFFITLGDIVSTVFSNLTGGKIEMGGGLEGFLKTVSEFMQMVVDNKDKIAEWATLLVKVFLAFQLIGTVMNIVIGIVIAVLTSFLAFFALIASIVGILTLFGVGLGAVVAFITGVLVPGILIGIAIFAVLALMVAGVILTFVHLKEGIEWFVDEVLPIMDTFEVSVTTTIQTLVANFVAKMNELEAKVTAKIKLLKDNAVATFEEMKQKVIDTVQVMKNTFSDQPWGTIGRSIIGGVARGVIHAVQGLIDAVVNAVNDAYDAALNAIGARSPSRLFANVGEFAMQGMAKGITDGAKLAVGAMQGAVAAMASPAFALPNISQQIALTAVPAMSSNTSTTNNFNLTVNSGAPTEPILQDYNMMLSLVQ